MKLLIDHCDVSKKKKSNQDEEAVQVEESASLTPLFLYLSLSLSLSFLSAATRRQPHVSRRPRLISDKSLKAFFF